ncbi:MAG: FTR1 family iron permease [Clostridia bacterium]|nr:FTR1 family iron permease [Clostridia bacterium]
MDVKKSVILKVFSVIAAALILFMWFTATPKTEAFAADTYYKTYRKWKATKAEDYVVNYNDVAEEIGKLLDGGLEIYENATGKEDYAEAYDCFSKAYGSWYETSGFEKKTLGLISSSRVTVVELQFANVKSVASAESKDNVSALKGEIETLKTYLKEDGEKLSPKDGGGSLGWATFVGCFTIMVREGLEAILIIAAMVAYLIKSGNKSKTKAIYIGAGAAIAASVLTAFLIGFVLKSVEGIAYAQEIIEGVTALIAVAVLIYVSNWMISKAEGEAWNKYLTGKVSSSVSNGKTIALGFTAFLAVYREGAEVILFYQPFVSSSESLFPVIGGLLAGLLVVAAVFVLIRVFGIKLPLKPFFMITSGFMALMSIAFLGSGIKELIEGQVITAGTIKGLGWMENDVFAFFGIYPVWATLIPQLILLFITVVTFILHIRHNKKLRLKAEQAGQAENAENTLQGE